jgi:hypothetical protein
MSVRANTRQRRREDLKRERHNRHITEREPVLSKFINPSTCYKITDVFQL